MAIHRYVYYIVLLIALGSNISPFLTLWGIILGFLFLLYMGIYQKKNISFICKDTFLRISILYFILWLILSTQSIEPIRSMESVCSTAYRLIPFFLVVVAISNQKYLKMVFLLFSISVLITDIAALYQLITRAESDWGIRVLGLSNSPTFFATHMLMAIPVLWWCANKKYFSNKEKVFLKIVLILSVFMLIASQTRGAWISFFVTGIIYAACCKNMRKKILIGLTSVLILIGGLSVIYPTLQYRLNSVTDMQFTSNSERVLMWKAAIEITKDYPLAGIGSDEFGYVYNTEYISPLAKERSQANDPRSGHGHPHNNILKRLSEGGIIGGSAFILFNLYILYRLIKQYRCRRSENDYSFALMGILVLVAVHIEGLTDTNFTCVPIMREFWLLMGLAWIGDNAEMIKQVD